jgi:hypothetical protein
LTRPILPAGLNSQTVQKDFRGGAFPSIKEPWSNQRFPRIRVKTFFRFHFCAWHDPPRFARPESVQSFGKELIPVPSEPFQIDSPAPDGPESP